MKLLLREYVASLREREELDAILPDLLSELGYTVYSRPGRGTAQYGVDIAAVGAGTGSEREVYLFSVKQGDLTRQDWHGTPQALHPSLDDIIDVYIPTHIPDELRSLRVVICLCFGGDVRENVRARVNSYIDKHTSETLRFEEWNGDRIAGLLLAGVLREELLPRELRAHFQKAIALVDEPDVAYGHFANLLRGLRERATTSSRARVQTGRQINICLWVMFVWARDVGNVEAPYRCSELAILEGWDLLRPLLPTEGGEREALGRVVEQLIGLHRGIAADLLEQRIVPHVGKEHAISMAIDSRAFVDVNLKLFDLLGRMAMMGLWDHWAASRSEEADLKAQAEESRNRFLRAGLELIENNPALMLPIADYETTDLSLFLVLFLASGVDEPRVAAWLSEMAGRLAYAIYTQGKYPTAATDYRALLDHPRERTSEYFEEATQGSTLIPVLACWLHALGLASRQAELAKVSAEKLAHSTMQLWTPDSGSEDALYTNSDIHGLAITDLPIEAEGAALLEIVADASNAEDLSHLSAHAYGMWPVVLLACRHWRLPVPPAYWIEPLLPDELRNSAAQDRAAE